MWQCKTLTPIFPSTVPATTWWRSPAMPARLAEDCAIAGVVVSLVPIRGRCPSAHTVIDRFDLWREGAHAVWLDEGAVRVSTVAERRGVRPWAPHKGRRE